MGPKKGSTHLEQKSPLRNVFKVTTMWHHLITSCNDIKLHHHKWPPSFYNQRKLLKLFLVIKAYDIIIWHQDDINTSSQVPSKLIQLIISLASKQQCKQRKLFVQNILRTFCPFQRRKVKSIEALDSCQKMCPTALFSPLITKTLLTYKYKGLWRLNARVLKANILSSENHHYIQNSSQTKQILTLSLYLWSTSRVCSSKSQTRVEKPLRLRD